MNKYNNIINQIMCKSKSYCMTETNIEYIFHRKYHMKTAIIYVLATIYIQFINSYETCT